MLSDHIVHFYPEVEKELKNVSAHHVAVMSFGHEKHPSHQISGGDPLCASTFPVTAFPLHLGIRVLTVYCQCDVIWWTETLKSDHDHTCRVHNSLRCELLSADSPPCTQKSQLYLSRVSSVVTYGAPSTISSTHLMARTILYRSS